ncbi:MAG TPA: hypothetical protein VGF14_07250 [Alphaproteobacteria bacterium]
MHEYYVFPHPTVAEGKPGLAAFKVNPNYGRYEVEDLPQTKTKFDRNAKDKPALIMVKEPDLYVDFNIYDIQQLLYFYGIKYSKVVQADSVAEAIDKSRYMDAEKLIASKETFDRQKFEMVTQRKDKSLTRYLRENHAYRIEFDAYPYNLGQDMQDRSNYLARDQRQGVTIGEKKTLKLANEEGTIKFYNAIQMRVDALFVKQPWEKDLAKTSKRPDDTVVFVEEGSFLVQTGAKFWDANSYIIMPDFAWQAKEMSGRKNQDDNQQMLPRINVA